MAIGNVSEHGLEIAGTTAKRPTNAPTGFRYFDTTISKLLVWSGTAWLSADGGSPIAEGNGAVAGTGVTVQELGDRTIFTFVNTPVVLADNAGVVAYGSLKIYDFPTGPILFLGAIADLAITKSSAGVNADWDGDIAFGTAAASNNASLSSTEANVIPSTATPQAASGATTGDCLSTSTESGTVVDGTGTAVDLYVNLLVDDADHDVTGTACNLILNGTLTLSWKNLA